MIVWSIIIAALTTIAQQPRAQTSAAPVTTRTFEAKCAGCHGAKMAGGTAPSILTYVRYHTDVDIMARLRGRMPAHASVTLTDAQLEAVLADLRVLAGTNPAMATGGFTGIGRAERGRGAGARGTVPPAPAGAAPPAAASNPAGGMPLGAGRGGRGGGRGMLIPLADGRTLSGTVVSLSSDDATVLADGKFVLLARDGTGYREKPIAPKMDWAHYSGSSFGNRYSTLEQINSGNVQNLAPAWIASMNASRGESTPIVIDGIMYVTGWNELYALDATTGRQLWMYSEPHTGGLLGDAAGANRGVAVSGDRVVMTTDDAHLLAFDRFTGQKLWDVELGAYREGYTGSAAPLIVGDLVVHGVSGGDEGIRGLVDAYRLSTGERVWRFYTIPARGEKGSETWKGHAIDHGCGGTWLTGSYDPELGLVYWGVGNPCPTYQGAERMGDNLYTSSVVALVANTGQLKWHYQFSPHDTHDWDSAQPMVLVDEVWKGEPRKLLMNANRNGMFYVLDRVNGELLLADKLSTKVTWNLGFEKNGRPIIDPGSIATTEGAAVCPAAGGGANWQATTYSPMTKLFYARVSDGCGIYTAQKDDPLRTDNRWMGGTARGTTNEAVQAAYDKLMENYPGGTFMRAMDPFTGKKVWDYAGGGPGALATAGGLLFLSSGGGLLALDAKAGKVVAQIAAGQFSSTAPMTYMVGGRQYIAVATNAGVIAYALREPPSRN